MEYKNEIRDVQRIEFEMLKKVADVCAKNSIEYFLIGGTALGAKRHSGFIPWDDDIDIGMERSHYERFLSIAQKELGEGLFLQTPFAKGGSPYPYAKVRKDRTKFIEWSNRNLKIHDGIYIDIFPFDNIPDSYHERKEQYNWVQFFSKLYVWKHTPDLSKPSESLIEKGKFVLRKVWHYLLVIVSDSFILKRLNENMIRYNQKPTKSKACLLFPKFLVEYLSNDTLYPLKTCLFENERFPVPNNLDLYLKTHYGNFMELPPEKDRVGHRPYKLEIGEK